MVNRITGEVLPPQTAFHFVEAAAFTDRGFVRGTVLQSAQEIREWREKYQNTGIFRSMLLASQSDFLNKYREESTLLW